MEFIVGLVCVERSCAHLSGACLNALRSDVQPSSTVKISIYRRPSLRSTAMLVGEASFIITDVLARNCDVVGASPTVLIFVSNIF